MTYVLTDIPTFYLVNGERVDYTEDERNTLLTEWNADLTRIENEKIDHLRRERHNRLAETDWIVIKEREEGGSVSNFADWRTYRQALRDITNSATSLDDVTWPEKPE